MLRKDFHFDLPDELIAQQPKASRRGSRLMIVNSDNGFQHKRFFDLSEYLQSGDLLVFNDTKVMPARLFGEKHTGGKVEILVERVTGSHIAFAKLRSNGRVREGTRLLLELGYSAVVVKQRDDFFDIEFSCPVMDILDHVGHIPLPPYIDREDSLEDRSRYQTVYARKIGAVAAPTAGLHFDKRLLASMKKKGVEMAYLTLHVGSGTFQPMRTKNISNHLMHSEWMKVSQSVAEQIGETKSRGGRVIAVGTTSVRSLETAARTGLIQPFEGETDLFISPGYQFKVVDMILTNFHLPESSLLVLVSAFSGHENTMSAYKEAITQRYRFFSYGDAMLLTGRCKKD